MSICFHSQCQRFLGHSSASCSPSSLLSMNETASWQPVTASVLLEDVQLCKKNPNVLMFCNFPY